MLIIPCGDLPLGTPFSIRYPMEPISAPVRTRAWALELPPVASVLCPLALEASRAKVKDERFANFSLCVPLWAMVSLISWAATAPTLARMRSSSILPWALVIEARTRLSHLFACSRLVAPKIGRGGKIKIAPFLGAFSPSLALNHAAWRPVTF